jgi:hypothetical protein
MNKYRKILNAIMALGALFFVLFINDMPAMADSATVTLGDLVQIFDGAHKSATAITDPPGLAVSITYNGSHAAPINAGSYQVVATVIDPIYTGSAGGTLVVARAPSVTTVSVSDAVYDKNPHGGVAVASGVGGLSQNLQVFYNGRNETNYSSIIAPVNAGDYTASASFLDGNHNISFDSRDFTVARADATINVTGYSGIYDGNPHGAAGTAFGVNHEDLSSFLNLGLCFTNVPGGTAHWSFSGDNNYNDADADLPIVITQATSLTNVSVNDATYSGNPHGGTAVVTGAGGLNQSLVVNYSGRNNTVYSSTVAPTNAGNYNASAAFNGDINHTGSSDNRDFSIAKAVATVTLTNLNQTHDGNPKQVAVQTGPLGLNVEVSYNGSSIVPVAVGDYAVAVVVNDINYVGTAAGTLHIASNTIQASAGLGG